MTAGTYLAITGGLEEGHPGRRLGLPLELKGGPDLVVLKLDQRVVRVPAAVVLGQHRDRLGITTLVH